MQGKILPRGEGSSARTLGKNTNSTRDATHEPVPRAAAPRVRVGGKREANEYKSKSSAVSDRDRERERAVDAMHVHKNNLAGSTSSKRHPRHRQVPSGGGEEGRWDYVSQFIQCPVKSIADGSNRFIIIMYRSTIHPACRAHGYNSSYKAMNSNTARRQPPLGFTELGLMSIRY